MVRHFNISLKEAEKLDLGFVYYMMKLFMREEKSKEFVKMALAGVDLKKSAEYQKFIREEIQVKAVDMSDMDEIKSMSLKLLKGGKHG